MEVFKKIPKTKTEYFLIVFLVSLVLPFLILHYFNNPNAEDFVYGEEAKRAGFINYIQVLYKYWGGRYFTYIFLSITPLTFKSMMGYKVFTLFIMLLFYFILYLFISQVAGKSLTIKEKIILSLSIFSIYLYGIPSVSEGFYWYASLVGYLIAIILILIFSIFYIRLSETTNLQKKIFYTAVSCLTIIAIAGSVELAAALIVVLIVFLIIKCFLLEKKIEWSLLIIALVTVIAVYISFSAPGNFSRAKGYEENHNFFSSVYSSVTFIIEKSFSWTFNSPLLPLTLLLIPIFLKIIKRGSSSNIFSINPIFAFLISFIFFFSNIFVIFWSMGIYPYPRIINFIYLVFLMGWFYNTAVLTFYINKKFEIRAERSYRYAYVIAVILIAFFLIRENNIKTAYSDLLGGAANQYNNEMKARYDYISQCTSDSCEVDSIKNIPGSFYFVDNAADPNQFVNHGYELYFNKKSISLKKNSDEKKQ
ncbi:MAG: DUF6056 family protein [Bacteroidota bacterium]|nr:DUF6056 family protein [Bacteroidota bacterium]